MTSVLPALNVANYSTVDDFQPLHSQITFNTGITTVCEQVQTIQDAVYEENETITLSLVSSNFYIFTDLSTTEVEILDNDGEYDSKA